MEVMQLGRTHLLWDAQMLGDNCNKFISATFLEFIVLQ
jgi:hypothetical protein